MVTKTLVRRVLSVFFNGGRESRDVSSFLLSYAYFYIAGISVTLAIGFMDVGYATQIMSHGFGFTLLFQLALCFVFSIPISMAFTAASTMYVWLKGLVKSRWNRLSEG